MIFLSVLGISINIVVCAACFRSSRKTRTKPKMLFSLSLIFSDLLHNVCFSSLEMCWPNISCYRMVLVAIDTSTFSQMLSMLALGIDMFIAIHHPLRYNIIMTKRKAIVFVVIFWVFSLVLSALLHLETHIRSFRIIGYFRVGEVIFSLLSVLVFSALAVLNTSIFCAIRSSSRGRPRKRTSQRKAVFTLSLIVITYVIFALPRSCYSFFRTLFHRTFGIKGTHLIAWMEVPFDFLSLLNSLCDPLIYTKRLPEIKNFFK